MSSWLPWRRSRNVSWVPALEALIEAFPFEVKGFHADNGSQYINHRVARVLRKLHVEEFTKSRPRRSGWFTLSRSGSFPYGLVWQTRIDG